MNAFKSLVGKRVLITGHTGFKGSWLCIWLHSLGAEVFGFALDPPTQPSMFEACNVERLVDHHVADVNDFDAVLRRVRELEPDLVIHLAAQPLVRRSIANPLETLSTNVLGTAHVLEAIRISGVSCSVIVVSSDKCYENREWVWGYREEDALGGKDPYSMSKGATELLVASWRSTYFSANNKVRLASARAGNVLGGGDWAADRIVPDCIRAFREGHAVEIRNPKSTRPWQHVLEPLCGYLLLACKLIGEDGDRYCSSWNFGPTTHDVQTVEKVVDILAKKWPGGGKWNISTGTHPKEAFALSLNCDKAIQILGWRPVWSLETALDQTASWFGAFYSKPKEISAETLRQIFAFQDAAKSLGLSLMPS